MHENIRKNDCAHPSKKCMKMILYTCVHNAPMKILNHKHYFELSHPGCVLRTFSNKYVYSFHSLLFVFKIPSGFHKQFLHVERVQIAYMHSCTCV